jgi:hypothetical protein
MNKGKAKGGFNRVGANVRPRGATIKPVVPALEGRQQQENNYSNNEK